MSVNRAPGTERVKARGRSVIYLAPKISKTYPSILGFAVPYQPSNVISICTSLPPSSSPSDCLRLRFSMFEQMLVLLLFRVRAVLSQQRSPNTDCTSAQ